jgi:hypothetical protein
LDRWNDIADGDMAALGFTTLPLSLSLSLLLFSRLLVAVGTWSNPCPSDFCFSFETARRFAAGGDVSFEEQV